jgi:hypothetical protein
MSPIGREEFEKGSVDLKEEILAFLSKNRDKAYTADEIMSGTSLKTSFDFEAASKLTVFIAANFVAFLNDLAAKGSIQRKVVNNRMYFMHT